MTEPNLIGDARTITVRIPISIRRRGGRKLVLAPDGTPDSWAAPSRRIDNALVKAVARPFRWRGQLETRPSRRSPPPRRLTNLTSAASCG
jgi:hypothetical protein